MEILPEVCRGPRNNQLYFGDDPDNDPESGLQNGSHGGSLHSLTDCLVYLCYWYNYAYLSHTDHWGIFHVCLPGSFPLDLGCLWIFWSSEQKCF